MARARTKTSGQVEIVQMEHNHAIFTQRRKKGSLKAFYAQKKSQQNAENT